MHLLLAQGGSGSPQHEAEPHVDRATDVEEAGNLHGPGPGGKGGKRPRVSAGESVRLQHIDPGQDERPEEDADERRGITAQDAPLFQRRCRERAKVGDDAGHSRSALPVNERKTSSRVTGTTSTCWMTTAAAWARSNAIVTRSRADGV